MPCRRLTATQRGARRARAPRWVAVKRVTGNRAWYNNLLLALGVGLSTSPKARLALGEGLRGAREPLEGELVDAHQPGQREEHDAQHWR